MSTNRSNHYARPVVQRPFADLANMLDAASGIDRTRQARLREAQHAAEGITVKVTATVARLYPYLPAGTVTMARKVAVAHRSAIGERMTAAGLPIGERNAYAAMTRRLSAAIAA